MKKRKKIRGKRFANYNKFGFETFLLMQKLVNHKINRKTVIFPQKKEKNSSFLLEKIDFLPVSLM